MILFMLLHAPDGDTALGSLLFNVDQWLRSRLGDMRGGQVELRVRSRSDKPRVDARLLTFDR